MSRARLAANAAAVFDGHRLTLARQLVGLSAVDLAALLNVTPATVRAWESGAKRPTAASVAQLALCLSVDPGFFADRPENLISMITTPHFRSISTADQRAREQAFAYGQVVVAVAYTIETIAQHFAFSAADVPSFAVAPHDSTGDGPEQAAQLVREKWGIRPGPVENLIELLEDHGVLVVPGAPHPEPVGTYSFDSVLRPVVVLNPFERDHHCRRFDVAYELGHLVMHADAEPGAPAAHDQAHRFATALLQPPAHPAALEEPSLLSSAVESLAARGIDEWTLIEQCRMPAGLFRAVIG